MSTTEGTNADTGVVALTNRQRKALDNKLVKFLATADQKTESLVSDALSLIDECIVGEVWKVAVNADGQPYEDGYSYVLDRIAAAPNFHKAIAHPIALRLLTLENDKGKRIYSVRQVEEATGVSRGKLNEMNQDVKRQERGEGADESGEQETEERLAAMRAVKRLPGALTAIADTVADMEAQEQVEVASQLIASFGIVAEMYKVAGYGDDIKVAIAAAREPVADDADAA